MEENRKRYIGLDVHKHYMIVLGVDAELNVVLPARRVDMRYYRSAERLRRSLMRLGIGSELQKVALDSKHPHRLASEAELLELMPDLKPPG